MSMLEDVGAEGALPVAVPQPLVNNDQMAVDDRPGQLEAFALEAFYDFLKGFSLGNEQQGEDPSQAQPFYAQQIEQMRMEDSTNLFVDWSHFADYNSAIADMVAQRFLRLEPSLRQAVLQFVNDIMPEYTKDDNGVAKDFFISVFNLGAVDRLRDLRVEKVGALCSFAGTVTRTSEVRPELYLGAFRCLECGAVVKGVEQQFKYTEPIICSNHTCGNRKLWSLVREDSVFVDWQRVKVQESVDEVPAGSLPRTLDVIVRNKQVEEAKAGDKSVFTGCLVVVPDVSSMALPANVTVSSGSRGGGAGGGVDGFTTREFGTREMTYRLMFIANTIQAAEVRSGMVNIRSDEELTTEEVLASYDPRHAQEVLAMKDDPQIYAKLTHSIAPSVWGHEAIKQAVLLMLLGGVHKRTPEGMALRGDINVAIVGDPACAKSQILKYVSGFLPRAIYTSGKASTAAGLTASVVKEPENNEFAIEAGALMLADNGVCCIDEFDKMDIKDQVAIHEAMEQQTISITKAGIQATLNARASILAAANPVGGRYDKAKPLKYNVALPPALLSRFDLLHVMLDETTEEVDNRIAQHIIRLHRYQGDAFSNVPYTTEQLQRYIKYARAIKPEMSSEAAVKLVQAYKELRSEDAMPGSASAYRITVRQLEALVRLSEAMARANCSATVTPAHVEASKRLLRSSILKIEQQDVDLDEDDPLGRPVQDPDGLGGGGMDTFGLERDQDQDMEDQQRVGGARDEEEGAGNPEQENMPGLANGAQAPAAAGASGRKAAASAAAPAAAVGAGAAAKKTKITAAKFTQMKGLLVKRMLEAQDAAYRAREAKVAGRTAPEAQVAEEGLDDDGGAADDELQLDAGMRQEDLMRWYMEDQQTRGVLKLEEDAEREMELLFKVINHLIKKDQVLAVLYRPDPDQGESTTDYLVRMQSERVLTLHASFNPDE